MPLDIVKVKKIMIKKNISNIELAKKMNVTQGRVSNLLNQKARTCRPSTLNSLANALDVDVEEIYMEE